MKWGRNLKLSSRALSRSWLRTTLSAAGVAVGVASVVILFGAGAGAERALQEALETLGKNLLVINAAQREASPLRGAGSLSTTLTLEDWNAIEQEVPGVLRVAPVVGTAVLARVGGRALQVRLNGTVPELQQTGSHSLLAGRFIDEEDVRLKRRVVVVGSLVVEELFGGESPLGESMFLAGAPFRIIGVMRKKGVSFDGANHDELIVIPLTTAMRRLLSVETLDFIYVQMAESESVPGAQDDIERLLRRRHVGPADAPDDFSIQDQAAMVRAQQQAGGSLSRLVIGLSALLVGLGGVGLLAVSLLSVRERYGEIGLRLAIGGRPRDILLQFFTEAVLISLLGGLMGLAVGAAGIGVGASLTRWAMVLSWQAVVYPLTISVAIAVVFGAYPALRAARLDPILALNSR